MVRSGVWALGIVMLGGASGDGCGPITDEGPPADTGDVTLDAGTLQDQDVAMDWRVYGAWDAGACLDLKFTNLGERITGWQFEMGFDHVVREIAWPGSFPSAFTVTLDEARLVPFGEPTLAPFASVSYAACLGPIVRPVSFRADVTREDDVGSGPEVPDADVYGSVLDDSGQMVLIWLDKDSDPEAFCLELRLGNLTTDRIEDWSVRVQFDQRFELRSTDTTFYYFHADIDELDVLPTNQTRVFDPLDVHVGSVCMDSAAVPVSFEATFRTVTPSVGAPGAPPPGIPGAGPARGVGGVLLPSRQSLTAVGP